MKGDFQQKSQKGRSVEEEESQGKDVEVLKSHQLKVKSAIKSVFERILHKNLLKFQDSSQSPARYILRFVLEENDVEN